ncbi:calcium/proton exchanger [compost metagenome]
MDLSLSIAIGSSVQVALFVAPVLVLASYGIGAHPMDLAFSGGLVLSVLLAVLITGQVAGDGRSDWLKGVQLLAVYPFSVWPTFSRRTRQSADHSRSKNWSATGQLMAHTVQKTHRVTNSSMLGGYVVKSVAQLKGSDLFVADADGVGLKINRTHGGSRGSRE